MIDASNLSGRVAALPEKYQPIYAHPELSEGSSRGCEDRLLLIRQCAGLLQATIGRPLRVLDLGCAQGFFSLSLAADGHHVHGVDFLDLNVDVCRALASEHPEYVATFEHAMVEDVIARLEPGDYDFVLGLSVFHHLVHADGIARVSELCRKLSEIAGAAIFEMALREEPLYWAPSLPQDPAELLSGFAFIRLLSRQATHLSSISRPLYFASSRFWYVADSVGPFDAWSGESHAHGRGTHHYSRRYYFGDRVFVKKMTLGMGGRAEINLQEFHNEVEFLSNPPASYPAPRLVASLNDSSDLFLVREMMEGRLLSELIDSESPYDADHVISELLNQLVILERAGLYHNDVRCWNVLISPEGAATLIDYGAISPEAVDCSWLGDLLLSFLITVKEILERKIVPSNPAREPALDFLSLPARYRNAFIRLFGQGQSQWTFAELQALLMHSQDLASPAPGWTSIYQHMQRALDSYNMRVGALYVQTQHDQVELMARAALLECLRETVQQGQEKLAELQLGSEVAAGRYHELEESSGRLAEWAKELETRALEAEAASHQLIARVNEQEANNGTLSEKVAELERELEGLKDVRYLAEQLTAEVAHLTRDRDALRARIASLLQKIERTEAAREHDRRRLKELKMDLSQRVHTVDGARQRIRELELAVDVLEGRITSLHASSSWRVTAPLRWLATRILRRGTPTPVQVPHFLSRESVESVDGSVPTPAEVALEKRLVALDQLGARIRKLQR